MVTVRLSRRLIAEIDVKNRFFSIVAHDLRSPFTVLMGSTALFKTIAENSSREEISEYAGRINAEATKIFGLVENLLDWSRLQLNQEVISPRSVPIRDIVMQGVEPLRPVAGAKSIEIDVAIDVEQVYGDVDMLVTVIRNLVDNAIKFCQPGGRITLSSRLIGDHVELTVQDTGVGIDAGQRETLFDVGTKTSTTGTGGEKGSGLGLPLCRDLLDKNDGEIFYDDTWHEGARFIVTLPSAA